MPIVYADVLVALNWLIDYLLLMAVGHLLRRPRRRWRVVLASLFGGACACLVLLPPLPTVFLLMLDVVVASVMVLIAFSWDSWQGFLKQTVVLFVVSAGFSGGVSLLYAMTEGEHFWVNNGRLYADISPLTLTICTVLSYGAVRLFEGITRRRMPKGGEYRLTVDDGEGCYTGRALCDTGLHLNEPFSGAPVIVVERRALAPFLSVELEKALDTAGGSPHVRVRMIPFRTVAGGGLLPAFRPRKVQLCRLGEKERDITGVYVAVAEELGRGEYEVLIGNEVTDSH